jgi:D-alanyl-D-alanine carboxypeptidase/D-alanyl-D-alanine-endopeptidase (penicillin-binding protein 4)
MMHRSDNFFAEQSLVMSAGELFLQMNVEKVIDTLLRSDFKNLPQKPRWVDGSGLSRYNLFSPDDLVKILEMMKDSFGMDRLRNVFPTGNEGTLTNYYKADSGYIYAKTGTLSGVVALSGFMYTSQGRLLIFSVLINNHQSSAPGIRKSVEKFISRFRHTF